MVKPKENLLDYKGSVVAGQYSVVYNGNYDSGNETSGSHPGIDITGGTCNATPIRSIAEGVVVAVYNNWQATYPGRNPCGINTEGAC